MALASHDFGFEGIKSTSPPLSGTQDLKPQIREISLSYSRRQMRLFTGKKQKDASTRLQEMDELDSTFDRRRAFQG